MDCKCCKTELTEMKNDKDETTCVRCLKCNPLTLYVPPASKASKYVDVPWTDERVIKVIDRVVPDMIREVLENWHIQKPSTVIGMAEVGDSTTEELINLKLQADTLAIPSQGRKKVDVEADIKNTTTDVGVEQKNWRTTAKELGIEVYDKVNRKPRLKIDVLAEIESKSGV